MEKSVAIVFDTEDAAYAGAEALRDLHKNGELAVHAAAVVGKDTDGKVEVKKAADEGPIGTAFGLMVGAMVGVLAGPAAVASGAAVAGTAAAAQAAAGGMALGGMTGGLFGAYRDLWVDGIDMTMLDQVALELLPGKFCVVASVDEIWTTLLDVKMTEAGGTVFRKPWTEAVDEQWDSEKRALDRELTELEDELKTTHDDSKAAVQAKVDAAKARITDNNDQINARLDAMEAELEAGLDALDAQIENAAEATKDKFVARKAELKEDCTARKDKLRQSAKLAGEALKL